MNDTTPATPSQHPRTNEGACESEVALLRAQVEEWEFRWNGEKSACDELEAELTKAQAKFAADIDLMSNIIGAHRVALEVEQAAHALTKDIYSTGALMNAAQLDSTRARITEIVDAVKAEREVMDTHEWGTTFTPAFDAARKHTDAMVRKHEGAGESEDESISEKALEREGFVKPSLQDDEVLEYWRNGKVCVMFYGTTPAVWVENNTGPNEDFAVEVEVVALDGINGMRDLNTLVRLFTAPDVARARDEG